MKLESVFSALLGLASTAIFSQTSHAAPLSDRLIIEIEYQVYSQREMQGYLRTKRWLSGGETPSFATQWTALLGEFREDMVIHFAASRVGGAAPTAGMISQAQEILAKRLTKETLSPSITSDLPITRSTWLRMALTVEMYRRQKQKDTNPTSGTMPPWLQELMALHIVRLFSGAEQFRSIEG